VPDPIVFRDELRVTIQQIGAQAFATQEALDAYTSTNPAAGTGPTFGGRVYAHGIFERRDDYCSVDFVYCRSPQAVEPLDAAAALADIGRLEYESRLRMEGLFS
jgi:hypothetical protein